MTKKVKMLTVFESYYQLELKAREIEEKQKYLKAQILEEMKETGELVRGSEFGSFTMSKSRSKWTYPLALQKLAQQLEFKQTQAQLDRSAVEEPGKEFLVFKMVK